MGAFKFWGLFGGKSNRPQTIQDISSDQMRREQISLGNEQRKLENEARWLDRDEQQLKTEYAEASSDSSKRLIARKIMSARQKRQGLETRVAYCGKLLQTINGIVIIKENMEFFERIGVASVISGMDMANLEEFIAQATVEGAFQQEKMAELVQVTNEGLKQLTATDDDSSLDDVMAELDRELDHQSMNQVTSQKASVDDLLAETMRQLDQAAQQGAATSKILQQESAHTAMPVYENRQSNLCRSDSCEKEA